MARLKYSGKVVVKREPAPAKMKRYCRECGHAYGAHERGADGEFFMTHCDAWGDYYRRFSRFLDEEACNLFEPRK